MKIDLASTALVLAAALVIGIAGTQLVQAETGHTNEGHQVVTLQPDGSGGVYQQNLDGQLRHCKSPAAAHEMQGKDHTVFCSDWQ